MEEEYKGWKIKYYEKKEIFVATKGDETRRSQDLVALRKRLKEKYSRKKAFYGTKEVEIASVTENRYGYSYWISYRGKYGTQREKIGNNNISKFTEKNKELIEQIREIDETRQELYNKRRKLDDQLERFTKDELSK